MVHAMDRIASWRSTSFVGASTNPTDSNVAIASKVRYHHSPSSATPFDMEVRMGELQVVLHRRRQHLKHRSLVGLVHCTILAHASREEWAGSPDPVQDRCARKRAVSRRPLLLLKAVTSNEGITTAPLCGHVLAERRAP